MSDEQQPLSVRCNACQRATFHEIVATHTQRSYSDDEEVWADDVYQILKCRGCGDVSFIHRNYFSEDIDTYRRPNGEWVQVAPSTDAMYPPRLARPVPRWLDDVPDTEVQEVLREVYTALQIGAHRLATTGVRTALERTMVNRVGDHGSFPANLTAFVVAGHLPAGLKGAFETVLDAGNASAHRAFQPDEEVFAHIMDAFENMLWQIYILPAKATAIGAATPPKPPKSPKPKT